MSDKKDMRPSGTQKRLKQRRRKAIALLKQGCKAQEVACLVGATSGLPTTRPASGIFSAGWAGVARSPNARPVSRIQRPSPSGVRRIGRA